MTIWSFVGIYVAIVAQEWTAWLAALVTLVGLVEFLSGRTFLRHVPPRWKTVLVVGLVIFSQAAAYKRLYDRTTTGANLKMVERISDFIEEAVQLKARYRVDSRLDHDYADPEQALNWESAVCGYLTKTRDRSFCIRFSNRLPPLDNPSNQRRDALFAAIDSRLERLEELQLDLAKPQRP